MSEGGEEEEPSLKGGIRISKSTAPTIAVLVVDDDDNVRRLLAAYLAAEGYAVREASDGVSAVREVRADPPHLVVLDLMLPGMDGLDAARQIKEAGNVPVLMLTARGEEEDVLHGFEAGADDYLTKPFSPKILMARVRAILNRAGVKEAAEEDSLEIGGLRIDLGGRRVEAEGSEVELTALEFDILHTLAQHPGWVYSRQQLLEEVWGYDYLGESRVVDVHVANLRKKIGDSSTDPRHIQTVRGVGYKLKP